MSNPRNRIPRQPPATATVIAFSACAWIVLNAAIVALSRGYLPFDRPNMVGKSFSLQVAIPSLALIEQLALMGLVSLLTRGRAPADLQPRVPASAPAGREVVQLLVYALLAQAGGWILGPALGFRPFSFHLAGTLVGCSTLASPMEACVWAGYNFIAFAVVPYAWFRRKYSLRELCLVFDGKGRDLAVLAIVLLVEGSVQLAAMPALLHLPTSVVLKAAPLSFILFLFGTVLPAMVTVYAILVPRYQRLTGSTALSVVLGGLSYAAMHLVEGWSSFSSLANGTLSLLFVFLSYTGPGMFKSFLTLRTQNAWVHALAYHAVAPHTLLDAPMIAQVFHLG